MQCYGSPFDAKYHSESGASRAVLEAGKNIDSLMLRYGRVDWASKANWQCNGGCVCVLLVYVVVHLFVLLLYMFCIVLSFTCPNMHVFSCLLSTVLCLACSFYHTSPHTRSLQTHTHTHTHTITLHTQGAPLR